MLCERKIKIKFLGSTSQFSLFSSFFIHFFTLVLYLDRLMAVPEYNRLTMESNMVKAKFQTRRAVSERETMTLQNMRNMAIRVICCTQYILK